MLEVWNFLSILLELFSAACLVTQSCPALCDPMDYSLPGSSAHGDSPGKNTAVDCHALLQRSFPTQGSSYFSWSMNEIDTKQINRKKEQNSHAGQSPGNEIPTVTKAGCSQISFRQRNNYFQRFSRTKVSARGVTD